MATIRKIYCGDGSDHQCSTLIEPHTIVVRAERELQASAFGDQFKQTRTVGTYFVPGHVPSGWTVVAGPSSHAELSS